MVTKLVVVKHKQALYLYYDVDMSSITTTFLFVELYEYSSSATEAKQQRRINIMAEHSVEYGDTTTRWQRR